MFYDGVFTAQCLNYLKATGELLLNFGKPHVDMKRHRRGQQTSFIRVHPRSSVAHHLDQAETNSATPATARADRAAPAGGYV
ncbi:MAG TPA: hypothetical protein VG826_35425 [Pirellulales bacterium]|nr:hypothetical protein [Pirellulales bacterium]